MRTSRLPAFLADHPAATGTLVLTGARVIDGAGGPVRDGAVRIVDGRIAAVGPAVAPRTGGRVLDVGGRMVLPGLIDAHAHLSMVEHSDHHPEPPKGAEPLHPQIRAHLVAATLRRALRMGVTTVRDVGAHGDVVLQARQAMRYGALTGPRLLTCARIVSPTAPGGRFFPGMYREADGVDDMRRAVREQIRAGADFVKLMTTGARTVELEDPHPAQLTREEVHAVVDEAHRQGYRVAAHCEGLDGTELAVIEGVDTIEHGMYLHRRPDLLDALADRVGTLVPTLAFLQQVAESGAWTAELEAQGRDNVTQSRRTVLAARERGVRMAMGYDSPQSDLAATEACRLVDAGLPADRALVAATAGGAAALGIDDEVGTLTAGRLADVVVVDGDPLDDPTVLLDAARIWLVLRNGDPVAGAVLEQAPPWGPRTR